MLGHQIHAEPKRLTDVLKWEANQHFCREVATLLAGGGSPREIEVGQVLGRRLFAAPAAEADSGNTGNGTVGSLALGPGAQLGTYRLECILVDDTDRTFAVYDPGGNRLANAEQGDAYAGQIAFTIAAGGTGFVLGDGFDVVVAKGDGKVRQIDFAAVDGTQHPWGISHNRVVAPAAADLPGIVASVRQSIVSDTGLVWPDGATSGQKASAIAALEAAGILVREAY